MSRPFRVLSLDGGGMRGLYTATLLDTLTARFARERGAASLDVGRGFDLITGTSTGGIIACALASGKGTGEIRDFYCRFGPKNFKNPAPRSRVKLLVWSLRNWRHPANSSAVLQEALREVFGTETLSQVFERRGVALCIPAVNLATQMGRVFKTPHNPGRQRDNNWTLMQVCLATSAAPIFLPIAECPDPDAPGSFAFVDGGLWANNPVLIGLIEALSVAPPERDIEVLSVGTCPAPVGRSFGGSINGGVGFWGVGTEILNAALNAQAQSIEYIVTLLRPNLARHCKVVRLPQSPPSAEQARFLGLDVASQGAVRILQEMGKHDADLIYGRASREDEPAMALVRRAWFDMDA